MVVGINNLHFGASCNSDVIVTVTETASRISYCDIWSSQIWSKPRVNVKEIALCEWVEQEDQLNIVCVLLTRE